MAPVGGQVGEPIHHSAGAAGDRVSHGREDSFEFKPDANSRITTYGREGLEAAHRCQSQSSCEALGRVGIQSSSRRCTDRCAPKERRAPACSSINQAPKRTLPPMFATQLGFVGVVRFEPPEILNLR